MNEEIKEILKVDKQLLDKIENILATELSSNEYDIFYNYFNEIRKPNILIDIKDVDSVKDYITNLQEENQKLKKELSKADSITQSCIYDGKKESEISYRKCLNMLEDYKQENQKLVKVFDELEKYIKENSWYYNTSDGCQWIDQFKLLDKLTELKGGSDEKVESEE